MSSPRTRAVRAAGTFPLVTMSDDAKQARSSNSSGVPVLRVSSAPIARSVQADALGQNAHLKE